MDKKTENKVKIINKTFESVKRDNKSIENVSLEEVAKELSMPLEELTSFFLTVEDIYLNEQLRNNRRIERYLESGLSKIKTANDAKALFENSIRVYFESLEDYADAVLAATFYIPKATVNPESMVLSLFFRMVSNISCQLSLLNILLYYYLFYFLVFNNNSIF